MKELPFQRFFVNVQAFKKFLVSPRIHKPVDQDHTIHILNKYRIYIDRYKIYVIFENIPCAFQYKPKRN